MRVTIQKVSNANCIVDNKLISNIESGLMILVGFTEGDNIEKVIKMSEKISKLRIFEDENKKMNKSIKDLNGSILLISQFTLYANTLSGNRPSFTESLNPKDAEMLYEFMIDYLNTKCLITTFGGSFGSFMKLNICCMGPVTINMEL